MKPTIKNIINIGLSAVMVFLGACSREETPWEQRKRNSGTETLEVNADELAFLPRGGKLNFTVNATYDGSVTADDWITLSAKEFPGDGTTYTIIITAESNKTESERNGRIVIKTPSLTHTITVSQPIYSRPDTPESITSAEDLVYWLETCAPYYEQDETITVSKDIDMSDVDNLVSAETFAGTFDGQGHKIMNWNSKGQSLFVKNNGKITDLTIDASCSFTLQSSTEDLNFGPFAMHNYGQITNCRNNADISVPEDASVNKVYIGGIAAYNYEEGSVSSCINTGAITFRPVKSDGNIFIGGLTAYGSGTIRDSDNYGKIMLEPQPESVPTYYVGGISARQGQGAISGCTNHQDASITANASKPSNGYIGGLVGYHDGSSDINTSKNYADIYCGYEKASYVGGLMGWQTKVSDQDFTMFEDCAVNCHISAYTKGKGTNGNNPCLSAGLVVGRFAGQANAKVCTLGTADKPICVAGSVTSLQTGDKVVASEKDFGVLASGDGSGTSANGAASIWQIINGIYKVTGDGQTGDPEEIYIRLDSYKLNVPAEGGSVSFSVKVNYNSTIVADADWLEIEEGTVEAGSMQEITVTAAMNDRSADREGNVIISMPLGTQEVITVCQAGNTKLEESIVLGPETENVILLDPAGVEQSSFTVTVNYDAEITSSESWLSFSPSTVPGDEELHTVSISASMNDTGVLRTAVVTVTLPKGLSKSFEVSQDKSSLKAITEISTAEQFVSFLENASNAELYVDGLVTKLTNDIDLNGVSLAPVEDYIGILDGDGHKIMNLASGAPLFVKTSGNAAVKNLVIDNSCKFDVASDYSAKWGILVGNLGPADATDKCSIENCVNMADITMSKANTAQAFIASMCGRVGTGSTVTGCENHGSLTISPEEAVTGELRCAGIAGSVNGAVSNCKNDAPITVTPADITNKFYVAGVVANTMSEDMENCVNTAKGKVTVLPAAFTSTKDGYVGGITSNNGGANIKNCRNFGDVVTNCNSDKVRVGGLLGFQSGQKKSFVTLEGCAVNCNVTGIYASKGGNGSTTPLNSCGLVVGRFGGQSAGNICQIGSEDSPVKVSGSVAVYGGDSVTLTADNYVNYLTGAGSKTNLCGDSVTQILNVKFETVTNE